MANSQFTAQHFQRAFPLLSKDVRVVYPGVDESQYKPIAVAKSVMHLEEQTPDRQQEREAIHSVLSARDRPTFVSVNRFEAKKNVALALEAFALVCERLRHSAPGAAVPRLILAGGYDVRVRDNIETLAALRALADRLHLSHATLTYKPLRFEPPLSPPTHDELLAASVVFLPSFPGPLLHTMLLSPTTRALLYTPTDEHFGIVPVEAMACGVPVVATNTGGPLESVVDVQVDAEGRPQAPDGTGFLLPAEARAWADACTLVLSWDEATFGAVADAAKRRVHERFSLPAMSAALRHEVEALSTRLEVTPQQRVLAALPVVAVLLLVLFLLRVVWLVVRLL